MAKSVKSIKEEKTVNSIIEEAHAHAKAAKHDEDNLFVMMGTIPGDTPRLLVFRKGVLTMDKNAMETVKLRGKAIFDRFVKYLKKAVCGDFKYCQRKDEVKNALDQYLPEIVRAIIKRIPITGKLPVWMVKILAWFGIATASTEVLVTMFVAWILIKGCDELCGCTD
jgi:hypothetical protein